MVYRNSKCNLPEHGLYGTYNPEYVLILSGDHIYKMDYEVMLDYHKANHADVTIACMPVPIEEASRFGVMITAETEELPNLKKNRSTREATSLLWASIFSAGKH